MSLKELKTPKLPKNDKRNSMDFSMRSKRETLQEEAHIDVFIKGEYKGYMIPEYEGCPRWYFCTPKNPYGQFKAGVHTDTETIHGKPILIEQIKEHYGIKTLS